MSVLFTKTAGDADQYFSPDNHVSAYDWTIFKPNERQAGFNQAVRELEVFLDRDMVDPTSATQRYRDDYAVFEQALFILKETGRTASPGGTAIKTLKTAAEKTKAERQGVTVSPMAQRFLELNRIKLVRG